MIKKIFTLVAFGLSAMCTAQVTPNINSGNPNFPFPQFKAYIGGSITLAQKTPVGVPHAELEQRSRDAYAILCNNMTYNINQGTSARAPLTVNGVKYIMPSERPEIQHCNCAEGDGYYLLAAAYMADKHTFDGYYMYIHDRQFQKTTRFVDNVVNSPDYNFSQGISGAGSFGASTNVYGGGVPGNSAADADVDIAMALLVAWKQWGDNALICTDPELGPVTYKNEAIKYIKTLVDTLAFVPSLPLKQYVSGIIGLDGYMKNGDSWNEVTKWAENGYLGMKPLGTGGGTHYVDYHAPAYFRSFANALQAEGQSPWAIEQYKRAETSSDWVMGQAYAQGLIPWIGKYEVSPSNTVTFSNFNMGEDFRYGWRTILNYLWNGNPTHTWNPTTHQYETGANTYQRDMALRFAQFLQHPENFGNDCFNDQRTGLKYGGISGLKSHYDMMGLAQSPYVLNWPLGPGAPSAVVSGNWELMAQMFRQCVTEFDDAASSTQQRYLDANPRYFQEWFRLLGMLVLTGNLHDPMQMQPTANMKIYKAVNKTYAFIGDTIQYTLSYRNYGKPDASNVVVKDTLPLGLAYVAGSSSKAINAAGSILSWTIGTVKGVNTANLATSKDSITFKVVVQSGAPAKVTDQATITCANGSGWKSNEYPNRISDVMERNYVDIIHNPVVNVRKSVSKTSYAPGDTLTYTVVVKSGNNGSLQGGRPGVIVTGAHDGLSASQAELKLKYRIYHGAHEPYIDYKNYRISYFINESDISNFNIFNQIAEGIFGLPTLSLKKLPQGASWNHMLTFGFGNQKAGTTPMLVQNSGSYNLIHEGAMNPLRVKSTFGLNNFAPLNLTNDWSAEAIGNVPDDHSYWPIAYDFTDPFVGSQSVVKVHPDQCGTVSNTLKKQLVEEWDGYTWRKIYGDAPISLLTLRNVKAQDTIAAGQTFAGFVPGFIQGTLSNGVISWPAINQLAASDSVVYKFKTVVDKVTEITDASTGSGFHVFPNPSELAFTLQAQGDFSYQIYDSKGLALEQGTGSNIINIGQNLRSGLYILKFETDRKTEYVKIEKK